MSIPPVATELLHVDCVVVGAGWTGLATSAALRAYGVSRFVMLESGHSVGSFWEGNYDRIKLHTPWHGLPCDGGLSWYQYPMFKKKREILCYLTDYHMLHNLESHTRFGERVVSVARVDQGMWTVTAQVEWGRREYRSRYVAICTSKLRVPFVPEIKDRGTFQGRVLHSREYRTGKAFRGERVLVVGSGNSAAEISADLVECGAADVTMLVHGPRLFVPLRHLAGKLWIARLLGMLSEASTYKEWLLRFGTAEFWEAVRQKDRMIASLAVDLSHVGISSPDLGFSEANIKGGRIGVFDQGAIEMIRAGRIAVRNSKLAGFIPSGVRLGDGSELKADVVVLATGFQPKLEEFVQEPELFLEAHQEGKGAGLDFLTPRTDTRGRSSVDDSLFFVGFDSAVNGGLSMGFWGWSTGFLIAQSLGLLPADQHFSLERLPERQTDVCHRRTRRSSALLLAVLALAVVSVKALRHHVM